MVPTEWVFLIGILLVAVLFLDARCSDQLRVAARPWQIVEPTEGRIRMLWIVNHYVPFVNAGSEICAHTVNKYLMKKPYKYDIWVAAPGLPAVTYEGIRCVDLYDTARFTQVVNSSHILHSYACVYRNQMRYICRRSGIPFVEWVHTDNYVRAIPVGKWIDPTIQERHWSVFNSKSLRDAREDCLTRQTRVFHPAVDFRDYQRVERRPLYVTLSNVNENKGGRLLIELAKALPDFQFLGVLGGYRAQITDVRLPNLRYVQNTTDMRPIYAQTWVQIMPSKEETWGRTAVEAMAAGIPVLASPTPGLRECCGDAAIFCNPANLSEWIAALHRFKQDTQWYTTRSALSFARARALDPYPELERLDAWLETEVLPSAGPTQPLGFWENNLLFR